MAHPMLSRITATRALAVVGATGAALVLPLGSAMALTSVAPESVGTPSIEQLCADVAAGLAIDDSGACAAIETVQQAVVDAVAPVVDAVAPVVESVPAAPVPGAPPVANGGEEQVPASPSSNGSSSSSSGAASATSESESAKVGAAGKNTTEVFEPQAPAADGRVATGPAISPDLGLNIQGVSSQSGLTLQPYEAPLVSIPMESPEIAIPASTTTTPVQSAAVQAIRFTGDALVPYTNGLGAWVAAAGLGMLGAAGYMIRRRGEGLNATTLDD